MASCSSVLEGGAYRPQGSACSAGSITAMSGRGSLGYSPASVPRPPPNPKELAEMMAKAWGHRSIALGCFSTIKLLWRSASHLRLASAHLAFPVPSPTCTWAKASRNGCRPAGRGPAGLHDGALSLTQSLRPQRRRSATAWPASARGTACLASLTCARSSKSLAPLTSTDSRRGATSLR